MLYAGKSTLYAPIYEKSLDGKIFLKGVDRGKADFARGVRSAIYRLWSDRGDMFDFVDGMSSALRRGLTRAWQAGAAEVGIQPDELTREEIDALNTLINEQIYYLIPFGQDIVERNKPSGGLLRNVNRRGEMWINRYEDARNQGKIMAAGNMKMEWVMGPTIEHCQDCLKYNGRVYRASIWNKYNIKPQSMNLSCHGFKCLCKFVATDKKVNKGFPPAPTG